MSSAGFCLFPDTPPDSLPRLGFLRWGKKVGDLIHYRSGYKEIAVSGAAQAFLSNRGSPTEFNFGEFDGSDELASLKALAQNFPGRYLGVWSYGHTVHVVLFEGQEEVVSEEFSFRLHARPQDRDEGKLDAFLACLDRTPLPVDREQFTAFAATEEISLKAFFLALGMKGARDLKTSETSSLWGDFESAATELLRGNNVDAQWITHVNAKIEIDDEDSVLPEKPFAGPGQTAHVVSGGVYSLGEVIGKPPGKLWERREKAARYYWDLTDCDEALERLTFGADENWAANGASLGRLLAHYPDDLMRDPIFLSRAALEAESANGHAYVEALSILAESCNTSGFTLAVFEAGRLDAFREKFGIEPFEENVPLDKKWAAEAFLDLKPTEPNRTRDALVAWFKESKSGGMILRAEADGEVDVVQFRDGNSGEWKDLPGHSPDHEALRAAALKLFPRHCFAALGLPDLLEPGEWQVGAYSGETDDERTARADSTFAAGAKVLADEMAEKVVSSVRALEQDLGGHLCAEDELHLAFQLPGAPAYLSEDLAEDLCGKGLIDEYGEARPAQGSVVAYTHSGLSTVMLCRALCDIPNGSTIRFAGLSEKVVSHTLKKSRDDVSWSRNFPVETSSEGEELDEDYEEFSIFGLGAPLFKGLFTIASIDVDSELVTDIVWEGESRKYLQVDLSSRRLTLQERLDGLEKEFAAVGYSRNGDIVCDQTSNIVVRSYAKEGSASQAVVLLPFFGDPLVELYTAFSDSTSLTTTTNPSASAPDESAEFQRVGAELAVAEIIAQHDAKIGELESSGRIAQPMGQDLVSLAQSIDEFLDRVVGKPV